MLDNKNMKTIILSLLSLSFILCSLNAEEEKSYLRTKDEISMKIRKYYEEMSKENIKFAEKQGKVAIPISSHFKPMGIGPAQWAEFEYQFRVVDKDDPEVKRTSLTPKVKVIIEKDEKLTSDKKIEDKTKETKDIYSELIKLDDLRKRGIITDEEFNARKKKILNEN